MIWNTCSRGRLLRFLTNQYRVAANSRHYETRSPVADNLSIMRSSSSCSRMVHSSSNRSPDHDDKDDEPEQPPGTKVTHMKMYKLLFSTLLFGGTLALVIYVRRKRSTALKNLLSEARRLPIDNNYECDTAQHMYVHGGYVLNLTHLKALQDMSGGKYEARSDDVYVVSFPKAGTTWVQEIVYVIGNNLNYEKAASQIMESRFPYLEYAYPGWQSIGKLTSESERYVKSHLPYTLLPNDIKEKNCKIIYVARNPKDTIVSYYFYLRMLALTSYIGTLKEFVKSFIKNEVYYGPYWKHVFEFWDRQNEENILFVKYEDLQKDLHKEIARIATFLGKCLSNEEIVKLASHVSFDAMASNASVNYAHWDDLGLRHKGEARFFRKGKIGDWKNFFTDEMDAEINTWIQQNSAESDLVFEYTESTPPSLAGTPLPPPPSIEDSI